MYTNELFIYNDITQESHCVEQKSLESTVDGNGGRGAERTPCTRRLNLKEGLQWQRLPKPQQTRAVFMKIALTQAQHTERRRKAESLTGPTSEP